MRAPLPSIEADPIAAGVAVAAVIALLALYLVRRRRGG
jgi:hypothetical protein